jgi:hypothetical protein
MPLKLAPVTASAQSPSAYEPPSITVIGTVQELTLCINKDFGSSDGFKFQGQGITCVS